jgi:potassium uptake Trk family protein
MGWIMKNSKYGDVVSSVGQARPWWYVRCIRLASQTLITLRALFTAASMFNDLGFTLTPDSMVSFQDAVVPLLLGSFLIVVGNTGFPIMLRFIIWVLSKFATVNGALWEELNFLLDHPRRCFTLLFPSRATWWLFWVLVLLNGMDLVFFIILDVCTNRPYIGYANFSLKLNDPAVTSIAAGYRVLDGLFQATSTRTAGFSVVDLANLHPAIQVSYLVMMYISVLPIAISVRGTNVYEEKSLGIWGSLGEGEDESKNPSYVGAHLRRQLSFDLWYLALGLFIISIAEGKHLQNVNEYVSNGSQNPWHRKIPNAHKVFHFVLCAL